MYFMRKKWEIEEEYRNFCRNNKELALQTLRELTLTPTETGKEDQRIAYCMEWMKQQGMESVHTDELGNVIWEYRPEQEKKVLYTAHLDTVFSLEEPLEPIGFGRIGKLLATRLRALGAHVTVSARNDGDKAYIRANGFEALDTRTLSEELGDFDTVVNTVPARIFTAERIAKLRPVAVCLDLASRPGGFDLGAAKALDRNVIWALGLPAETAPETAGRIVGETVLNILREKRA